MSLPRSTVYAPPITSASSPSSIMAAEPAGYVLMKATATISIARNATKAKTFSKMFFVTDPS